MVRRWSHINQMNALAPSLYRAPTEASFESTVNACMYLRKPFYSATTLTRRKWARRRHLSNWLALANVMSNWSSAYLFYRHTEKATYSQFLTRYSYLSFGILAFKNSLPAMHRSSETVISSTLTKKILRYFSNSKLPRFYYFRSLKFTNVTFTSLLTLPNKSRLLPPQNLLESTFSVPFLVDAGNFLLPFTSPVSKTSLSPINSFLGLTSLSLQALLSSTIALRKLLIMLLHWSLSR